MGWGVTKTEVGSRDGYRSRIDQAPEKGIYPSLVDRQGNSRKKGQHRYRIESVSILHPLPPPGADHQYYLDGIPLIIKNKV